MKRVVVQHSACSVQAVYDKNFNDSRQFVEFIKSKTLVKFSKLTVRYFKYCGVLLAQYNTQLYPVNTTLSYIQSTQGRQLIDLVE